MNNQKITFKYFITILVGVLFTWIIHEFSHWLTAKLLGYESIMTLNGTFYNGDKVLTDTHDILVSASGPVVTVLQGLIIFLLLKYRGWNKYLYPLLFIAFYMRFLAGLINFINLNDEGRISEFFGIGTYTLSIIISSFLFYIVFLISKKYNLKWKFQLLTTLFIMLTSSILILSDMYFGIRLL